MEWRRETERALGGREREREAKRFMKVRNEKEREFVKSEEGEWSQKETFEEMEGSSVKGGKYGVRIKERNEGEYTRVE